MKKAILISASLVSSMFLFGCGDNANYTGCWKGEANMIFEVLTENQQDFTIRNVNGDLSATIQDGKLCGKNSLDMPASAKKNTKTSLPRRKKRLSNN